MALESYLACDQACCKAVKKMDIDLYNGLSVRLKQAAAEGWSFTWKPENCLAIDKAYCPEHSK